MRPLYRAGQRDTCTVRSHPEILSKKKHTHKKKKKKKKQQGSKVKILLRVFELRFEAVIKHPISDVIAKSCFLLR